MEKKLLQILTFLSLLISLLTVPLLSSHRFILFAFLPILFFSYICVRGNKIKLKLNFSDFGWLIFLLTGFLSYYWSINGSLIWFPAFGYLSLFFWMLIFRGLSLEKFTITYLPTTLLVFFCVTLMYIASLMYIGELEKSTDWNENFGYNLNYISIFLVSLYPFLLFYSINSLFVRVLRLISGIFISYLVYEANARGASIAFIILVLFYFWNVYPMHIRKLIFWGGLISICLTSFIFYDSKILNKILQFSEFGLDGDLVRYYMIQSSFEIFMEKPILGIGLGNWRIEAYQNMFDIIGFNTLDFVRLGNHNLYSQHLSELGIIGFLGFYYPIYKALSKGWLQEKKQTAFQKAAFASLIIYLIASFIYLDASIYEGHFTGIQLLAFCSIGIITSNSSPSYKETNIWIHGSFLLLAITSFIWFIFYYQTTIVYNAALDAQEYSETNSKAIELIESIYCPIFKTTHGYKNHTSTNESLALQLANLYKKEGKYDKAEDYYHNALKYAPYDENIQMAYAKFLLRIKNKPIEAKESLLYVNSIQEDYLEANVYLAEIAISEGDYNTARRYMNAPLFKELHEVKLRFLEYSLYHSDYLDSLVNLTNTQRVLFSIMKRENEKRLIGIKRKLYELEEEGIDNLKEFEFIKRELYKIYIEYKPEKEIFRLLTKEQHIMYLEDKLRSTINCKERLNELTDLFSMGNSQKATILDLIIHVKALQRDIELRQQWEKKQKINSIHFENIDNLNSNLHEWIKNILNPIQYEIYKKNQLKVINLVLG